MKSIEEFYKVFAKVYQKVATTGCYSMKIANRIGYGDNVNAIDMPKEMAMAVEREGGGCCFHHSWRLIHELTKVGIPAYWASVPEPNDRGGVDQKCVVVYETLEGERYVADIVEDIKAGVKTDDFVSEDTCRWINGKGETVDHSKIALEEMARISDNPIITGYLKIYPKPKDNILFTQYYRMKEYEFITID